MYLMAYFKYEEIFTFNRIPEENPKTAERTTTTTLALWYVGYKECFYNV
jgi:hypothetical protein